LRSRGGDVAAAQLDHAEYAVRRRGVPVCPQRLGGGQGILGGVGGVGEPAGGQVNPRMQDGQRRLGGDAAQRAVVGGVQYVLRLVEPTQVDQPGGEGEQRLDVAGVGRDPGAVARGVT
jgi:hypothetical protein